MLRVGLTGGIGAGKSTVSARLAELGAVVVDADRLAREVVEPGTEGLEAVVERFGTGVLDADGALDRAALGRIVFEDAPARRDLEAITHPRIAARTAERLALAPSDAVVVHDVPLLVEKAMGAAYHLVVVVDARAATRLQRLATTRGMSGVEAHARIAAQATDAERRDAADVWLTNETTPEALVTAVDALWAGRLVPYEENIRLRRRAAAHGPLAVVASDPGWPPAGERLVRRIRKVLADRAVTVDHIGSTSVPGLVAKDVIDVQIGVEKLAAADEPTLVDALADAGFPRIESVTEDSDKDDHTVPERLHGSADPGRAAHVHVREVGSPRWLEALRFRDWLRAEPAALAEYAGLKLDLASRMASSKAYAEAKQPWFDTADSRIEDWARSTRWHPAIVTRMR